jgi:hypothetical protein
MGLSFYSSLAAPERNRKAPWNDPTKCETQAQATSNAKQAKRGDVVLCRGDLIPDGLKEKDLHQKTGDLALSGKKLLQARRTSVDQKIIERRDHGGLGAL